MVTYTMDTNILSAIIKRDTNALRHLQEMRKSGNRVTLNAISYFECRRGLVAVSATKQLKTLQNLAERGGILMLNREGLDIACDLYADLRKKGQLIEDADLLIAATALTHNSILVTDNTDHFQRIPNLQIENWIASKT